MKNKLLKSFFTGLALSVAGLATAENPVQIFTHQLTSHAAISGAALSLTAGSMIGGDLAAGAAATLGAGSGRSGSSSTHESYQPNLFAGAAVTLGASSVVNDIIAGAALTLGADAQARNVSAGAAFTMGASSVVNDIIAGAALTLGAAAQGRNASVGAAFTLGAGASVEQVTPDSFARGNGGITTPIEMDNAVAQVQLAKDALYRLPTTLGEDYQLATTMTGGSFAPGVYHGSAVTFAANSQIQYKNDTGLVNPVWIFNLDSAMNVGAMSTFEALDLDSGTVIWNIGGALTLGAGTDFSGVAFVEGAVIGVTSWVTCGNLYATAAISIGSINEAAVDCSVSAQKSVGLTVSTDNVVLLDGNAVNVDAPKCSDFAFEWLESFDAEASSTHDCDRGEQTNESELN